MPIGFSGIAGPIDIAALTWLTAFVAPVVYTLCDDPDRLFRKDGAKHAEPTGATKPAEDGKPG